MARKSVLAVALLVLAALGLAACGSGSGGSSSNTTDSSSGSGETIKASIVKDWPTWYTLEVIYDVAEADETMAQGGVEPHFVTPPEPTSVAKMVGTGQADFGVVSLVDLLNAQAQGLELVGVSSILPRDYGGLAYFKGAGMTSPKDLVGKTIANYQWPQTEAHLTAMLAHYGISRSEVNIVPGGNSTVPLMIAGKVEAADAAVGSEMIQMEEGAGKPVGMWLYTENGVPPFYSSVLAVNKKYLEEADPKTITTVIQGLQEAMEKVNQDPQAAFEISKEKNPEIDVSSEVKAWAALEPFQKPYKPGHPAGYLEPSIITSYEKFAAENELIEGEPAVSDLVTNEFLK